MVIKQRYGCVKACLFIVFLFFVQVATAGPWAATGDIRLRHDLQLLADSGYLSIPLTAWPISWPDVSKHLDVSDATTPPEIQASLLRVQLRIEKELNRDGIELSARLAAANNPIRFRTFSDTPREEAEAEIGVDWIGDYWAYHLQGAYVLNPADSRSVRFDGSYVAGLLGNWMFSADAIDRWWGPGWEGSLILSNNARPVPGITIRRNLSDPFDFPVLEWLGPWQFVFSMGRLEGARHIPHALLMGMRFNFKPTPGLEIGLSRTAQWAGQGRPRDFSTFLNLLIGRDHRGASGITLANEPGNQLGGYDIRWSSSLLGFPFAIYSQWIGEDSKGYTPKRFLTQAGLETWGGLGGEGSSWRLHVEYSNTLIYFWRNKPQYDSAYHHSVYRSGYRYYGRSLGHAMDGDGQMISVGGLLIDDAGRSWEALVRSIRTNQDGVSPGTVQISAERILSLELRSKIETRYGDFMLGANILRSKSNAVADASYQTSLEFNWQQQF